MEMDESPQKKVAGESDIRLSPSSVGENMQ
jgi:hypothetical protein